MSEQLLEISTLELSPPHTTSKRLLKNVDILHLPVSRQLIDSQK